MKQFFFLLIFILLDTTQYAQDNNAPQLTFFSFSPSTAFSNEYIKINFNLSATDLENEIEKVIVEFTSESGGGKKSQTFNKINQSEINLYGEIDFGNNPKIGIWRASIYLEDTKKNKITFSPDDLVNLGFDSFFEIIENVIVDSTSPILIGFTFSPDQIDLSNPEATIKYSISANDDLSGLDEIKITFSPESNGGSKIEKITKINELTASFDGSIDFRNAKEGLWNVEIELTDNERNSVIYTAGDLENLGFVSSLVIYNTSDIYPPILTGFKIISDTLFISDSEVKVDFTISATDSLSGIDEIKVSLTPPGNGGSKFEKFDKINENTFSSSGSVELNKNSDSGVWTITIELKDNERNSIAYNSEDLEKLGFSSNFIITEMSDSLPPALKYFTFSLDTNYTQKNYSIDFSIAIEDDLSGIDEVKVMFDPMDNGGGKFVKFDKIDSTSFDFSDRIELNNPKEGEWYVSIALSDNKNNDVVLNHEDLQRLGYRSSFTIGTARHLDLVSPSGGEMIDAQNSIDIIWEANGIEKVKIDISFDNGNSWSRINSNIPATQKKHKWILNNYLFGTAVLRISDNNDDAIFDQSNFQLIQTNVTSTEEAELLPSENILFQNYPNPFNPSTNITYTLKEENRVTLAVYNMVGEKIAEVFDGIQNAGKHTINFNGNQLCSGYYFYQLKTDSFIQTRKMLLIK